MFDIIIRLDWDGVPGPQAIYGREIKSEGTSLAELPNIGDDISVAGDTKMRRVYKRRIIYTEWGAIERVIIRADDEFSIMRRERDRRDRARERRERRERATEDA